MAKITRKQIAVIHIARSQINMPEETYRDILAQFGVKSSKELQYSQFKQLMAIFERNGFADTRPRTSRSSPVPRRTGQRAKGSPHVPVTDKQKARIWGLWQQVSTAPVEKREQALHAFVKKQAGVDRWYWLTVGKAQRIIFILEKMAGQHDAGKHRKNKK